MTSEYSPSVTRRAVLKSGAAAAAALSLGPASVEVATGAEAEQVRPCTIGIQVGAVSFVDEGVDAVLDTLQQRGIKLFCSCEDQWKPSVPGFDEVTEVDLYGRKASTLCLMHPDVGNFWTSRVTGLCTSYDLDGILFFNERNGPLLNALGTSHFPSIASSRTSRPRVKRQWGILPDRERNNPRSSISAMGLRTQDSTKNGLRAEPETRLPSRWLVGT